MSRNKKKNKKRARARLCRPPICERITLQQQCERCRTINLPELIGVPPEMLRR